MLGLWAVRFILSEVMRTGVEVSRWGFACCVLLRDRGSQHKISKVLDFARRRLRRSRISQCMLLVMVCKTKGGFVSFRGRTSGSWQRQVF